MRIFEKCDDCKYKIPLAYKEYGECRRFPPQTTGIPDGTGVYTRWEFPPADYRCGEYKSENDY